jgi:glutaredoxin
MDKKVITYTKSGCPYCVAAKEDLGRRKIAYEEKNLYGNAEALSKVVGLAGKRLLPVIVDGDNRRSDFKAEVEISEAAVAACETLTSRQG